MTAQWALRRFSRRYGQAMRPLSEVRELVVARCPVLPTRRVSLAEALGCVVATDVVAGHDLPGFTRSAMDGFAVRSQDVASARSGLPVVLEVIETVNAGQVPGRDVGPRQAVRIMTGAPLPDGADAVVPVEVTRRSAGQRGDDETVAILDGVAAGEHVRGPADDAAAGATVVAAGTVVTAPVIGVLASVGATDVEVAPRPRVGVISTGDELVEPPRALGRGQIRDTNRPMLLARLREMGVIGIDLGWIRDDVNAVAAALRAAAFQCDVILTSGGVSMGEADVVKVVLERLGEPEWLQVAIRPAKPFAVATVEGTPLLGLPGNPVSALVSFELLARPAIRHMWGHASLDRPRVRAQAAVAMNRRPDGKEHLVRVRFGHDGGTLTVTPVAAQGSHQLVATASASGLAVLPDGHGVAAGESVSVLVLDAEALAP